MVGAVGPDEHGDDKDRQEGINDCFGVCEISMDELEVAFLILFVLVHNYTVYASDYLKVTLFCYLLLQLLRPLVRVE